MKSNDSIGAVDAIGLFTELTTERLRISPLGPSDAKEMYGILQDQSIYRFIPSEPPASEAALRDRYGVLAAARSPDGRELWYNWIIREARSSACLGYVQATICLAAPSTCLLAYALIGEARGRGLGRESVGAVVGHLRRQAECSTFKALIDTRNVRSSHLVESLGFAKTKTIEAADYFKGSKSDEFEYQLRFEQSSS
jgi:[ribosomal protein S5]-alanine N-acetyltransferase